MSNKNAEFYLRHTGPCTQCHNGPFKQIYSLKDLAKYTAGYPLHMSIPYTIVIERFVDKRLKDKYTILVGDRLIYPSDIATFLTDQYKNTFNFDANSAENKPVMLDSVPGHLFVRWHYLTIADVFVERKTLNQIWPVETGKPPINLVQMMNRKNLLTK